MTPASERRSAAGDVVRVANQRRVEIEVRQDEWPQVAYHSVVSGKQFVEGTSAANVLVVEYGGRRVTSDADQFVPKLLLDLRGQGTTFRKKLGHPRESMPKIVCA